MSEDDRSLLLKLLPALLKTRGETVAATPEVGRQMGSKWWWLNSEDNRSLFLMLLPVLLKTKKAATTHTNGPEVTNKESLMANQ